MAKKIFITGGTGYVGTQLTQKLLARGDQVRVLLFDDREKEGLEGLKGLEFVKGNLLDAESLREGVRGCDRIFHVAAYAKNYAKNPEVFFKINVQGTQNVLNAARAEGGIQKIVCTSTIVTLGPTLPGQIGDESMPRNTPRYYTDYEASKAQAEKELVQASKDLPITIVNPTRVYGPGKATEGNSLSKMLELYSAGKFPFLLNGGRNIGNYVFVPDLVQGHVLAMDRGRVGERYILGGENASLREFFEIVGQITGRQRFQMSLPSTVARVYSQVEEFLARTTGRYPTITPSWVDTFLADWAFSCSKAERELGYQITPLREGLAQTWNWLTASRLT